MNRFEWLLQDIRNGETLPDRWQDDENHEAQTFETTADYIANAHLALLDATRNQDANEKRTHA